MNDIKTRGQIMRDVILNEDIKNLLNGKDGNAIYKPFVEFQRKMYDDNGLSIEKEGFQIGNPWDGDLNSAHILFLSPHPAFNWDEVCPRYYAENDRLALSKDDENSGRSRTIHHIDSFLSTHIQKVLPDEEPNTVALEIPLSGRGENGEKRCNVGYWGSVRNHVEALLPVIVKAKYDEDIKAGRLTKKQYACSLMHYAVLTSLVPFRVNGEQKAIDEAAKTCWEEFTQHTLARSGASIIVLVGKPVLDKFTEFAFDDEKRQTAREKLEAGKICSYTDIAGCNRLTVWMDLYEGGIAKFEEALTDETMDILKAVFAGAIGSNKWIPINPLPVENVPANTSSASVTPPPLPLQKERSMMPKKLFLIIALVLALGTGYWFMFSEPNAQELIKRVEQKKAGWKDMLRLSKMYFKGEGVKGNLMEALKLGQKLSRGMQTPIAAVAEFDAYFGQLTKGGDEEFMKALRRLADNGDTLAQSYLGYLYYWGKGVQKNYETAFRFMRKPAEDGNTMAQYYLGFMYLKGDGIAQDMAKGFAWLREAARQKDHDGVWKEKNFTEMAQKALKENRVSW